MLSDGTCLLAFDTSAAHCAAALLSGGRCVARRDEAMGRGQAERLMPMLGEVLAEAGLGWGDLDGIGVGIGPGNFTGLRLAVATARGLAMARGIPAIGVSGFEAIAAGSRFEGPVLALLENRRGPDFMQAFLCKAGVPEPLGPAGIGSETLPDLPPGTLCLGHDAAAAAAELGFRAGSEGTLPDAEIIARRAAARLGGPEAPPAPLYLRNADAAPSRDRPPVMVDES